MKAKGATFMFIYQISYTIFLSVSFSLDMHGWLNKTESSLATKTKAISPNGTQFYTQEMMMEKLSFQSRNIAKVNFVVPYDYPRMGNAVFRLLSTTPICSDNFSRSIY